METQPSKAKTKVARTIKITKKWITFWKIFLVKINQILGFFDHTMALEVLGQTISTQIAMKNF